MKTAQMAANLAGAAVNWARHGFPLVSPEALAARLEVCRVCEWWDAQGYRGTGRCLKCGCSTQTKLRMATSKCPDGKW